ncbi:MAG: hypothetical protein AAGA99_17745 [Actinomycetota bacterium]
MAKLGVVVDAGAVAGPEHCVIGEVTDGADPEPVGMEGVSDSEGPRPCLVLSGAASGGDGEAGGDSDVRDETVAVEAIQDVLDGAVEVVAAAAEDEPDGGGVAVDVEDEPDGGGVAVDVEDVFSAVEHVAGGDFVVCERPVGVVGIGHSGSLRPLRPPRGRLASRSLCTVMT